MSDPLLLETLARRALDGDREARRARKRRHKPSVLATEGRRKDLINRGGEKISCRRHFITAEGLINMTRLDDRDDLLLKSSGAPVSELDEIQVVGDAGNEVPDGEPGELVTRGPYTIRGCYMKA